MCIRDRRYGTLSKTLALSGLITGSEGIGRSRKWVISWDGGVGQSTLSSRTFKLVLADPENEQENEPSGAAPEPAAAPSEQPAAPEDEDAEEAPDAAPDAAPEDPLLRHGVQWKLVDNITEDQRVQPRFGARIRWGNDLDERHRTIKDYFCASFPMQHIDNILQWSATAMEAGQKAMTKDELFQVLGVLYALTRTRGRQRDLWNVSDDMLFPAACFGHRFGLTQRRFQACLRSLRVGNPDLAHDGDKWSLVRPFIDAFNERRASKFYPSWQLVVDESVSSWRGKDGNYCSDGLPHVTKIARKPEGVGLELKDLACAETKVIIA
eukprot:TRINITY_DN5563_c0_g1_i3.p1 TRINITY_DN5563_c0_g1~~TRINITY_DN5563_c0_g1_i3.p1  ORF type:complete len:323 (+),score=36.49 TRINITY_DN5563_c0_g1_i3:154-1122(+)